MRRGYIDINGGQVHWACAGPDNGDSLILLHQTPMWGVGHYRLAMEALARLDWRVVAIDTPGYGLSSLGQDEANIESYARVVWQAADALKLDQVSLFGRATGSTISVQCAIEQPERVAGLVLHGLTVYTAQERADRLVDFAPPYQIEGGGFLDWLTNRIRQQYPHASGIALRDQLLGYLLAGEDYATAYRAVWHFDIEVALQKLDWGLVRAILFGSADRLYDKHQRIRNYIDDDRLVMLAGASDFIAAEEPGRFAQTVDRALRSGART